ARVVDAWAAVPDLAEPVGPIEAALALDGQTIAVERLHVAGRPGAIRAAGTLTWSFRAAAAPVATNLGLVVDGFTLPPGGLVAGRLDGALALNGTWPELFLGGRVELAQARVRLPEVADPTWSEIRIHGLPGEEGAAEQARRADADGAPPP